MAAGSGAPPCPPPLPFARIPQPPGGSTAWLTWAAQFPDGEDEGALNNAAQSGKTGPVERGEKSRSYLVGEQAAKERFNNSLRGSEGLLYRNW